ncbi:hypothetical protein FA15DRAFT_602686, partial [Coprinopsis marcescibilis]
LQANIKAMITPTWTSKIPENLRQASHGKLKADQWRLLGTVYLPASLIRLWAHQRNGPTASDAIICRQQVLEITMSLFSAVSIATVHTTSEGKAELYLQHIQAYCDRVKNLYLNYQFRPNHHMAFHLSEYLCMYSPVHSWWTFPFERIIGMLQCIPTNNKLCKSPHTYVLQLSNSMDSQQSTKELLRSHLPAPATFNRFYRSPTAPLQ